MARLTLAYVATLTVLLTAGPATLIAQGPGYRPAPSCPPGSAPARSSQFPHSSHSMGSDMLSDVPPAPSSPSGRTQQSFADERPFDGGQMSNFNPQPPVMATPTFTPSGGPTTAATSPQAAAPNMIGDLFGTSFSGAVPVVVDNFFGFGDFPVGPHVFNTTSAFSFSASDLTTLYIGRSTDPLTALTTVPGFPLTATTVGSQSAISAGDPTLSIPVSILNNAAVQSEVALVGAAIHGPGEAQFNPAASTMELNPALPIVPPMVTVDPEAFWNYNYVVLSAAAGLSNLGAAPGAMVGRQKISENSSPLPRDRVFVNYSYFHNTPLQAGGVDVNRVTPGFEKTFFGGDFSIEVRAPFATTLDSDIIAGGITDTSTAEFGNLTMYFKALLWDADNEAISAGVGLAFPTANDVTLTLADGTPLLDIENESIHILPFIGALFLPTEQCFVQAFVQADIDPNGNSMRFTSFANGLPTGNLFAAGRPNDADYIFLDVGVGYWVYRAPCTGACHCGQCDQQFGYGLIRGIAPTIELHYNGTFNEADTVIASRGSSTIVLGDGERSQIDLLNLVLGVTLECRHNANLTIGYATPINGKDDEQFDSELRVMFNWFFGGPDRVASCGRYRF